MAWPPVVPPATRTNATPQVDAHPADHNQISTALTAIVGGTWTALPLASGWTPLGAPYQVPQYRLVGDVVTLRGLLTRAAGGVAPPQTVFTMPAGFRPAADMAWLARAANATVTFLIAAATGVAQVDSGASFQSVWVTGISYSVTP